MRALLRISAALAAFIVLVLSSTAPSLQAQGILDRMKARAKQKAAEKAANATNQVVDSAFSKTGNAIKCAVSDAVCIQKAKDAGQTPVLTDASGNPLPGQTTVQQEAGGALADGKPFAGVAVNFDFVPGERPLFVEDFAKDNVGDFPRRLELVDGNMEVAEWRGNRYLRVTSWPGKIVVPLPEVLPERFTVEFDATPGYNSNSMIFRFADGTEDDVRFRYYGGKGEGGVFGGKHQAGGTTTSPITPDGLYRGRIMADGRYVKVYMADTRIANIPNAEIGRSKRITIEIPGTAENPVYIGNIRVMAGGKKLADALATSGRVAVQGIYFDTGSDRIRPESAPTLREIAAMLEGTPDLKLTIEGHTDNVGAAAANQALSEKRAAAVKAALVGSFGVDGARLATKGLGATKPVASNDTPEGRQQNRRVELVKM